MLARIFEQLDLWVQQQNKLADEGGTHLIQRCEFKVLGQSALFEANLQISLAATGDLNAYTDANYVVLKHLDILLEGHGMHLDPFSQEIWMPEETVYLPLYLGEYINAQLAAPEYVLVSKALKAPERNADIIAQYIATDPPPVFFELCKRYEVDLQKLLEDENNE